MSKALSTRQSIIQRSFDLIYQKGYQSTSIDEIIATTQLTKGAFFYHFKNKEEMGLAVVNELLYPNMIPFLGDTLRGPGNIRHRILDMMKHLLFKNKFFKVEYGCPVVNLIDEMSSVSGNFRKALKHVVMAWQTALETEISAAQKKGELSTAHDARQIAQYIISNYGGARGIGKIFGKPSYTSFIKEFEKYLNSLD